MTTENEAAETVINTLYIAPAIPVDAARLIEAGIRAALTAERRAVCREIVHAFEARGWVFEDQEGGPEADVAAVLDEIASDFAEEVQS